MLCVFGAILYKLLITLFVGKTIDALEFTDRKLMLTKKLRAEQNVPTLRRPVNFQTFADSFDRRVGQCWRTAPVKSITRRYFAGSAGAQCSSLASSAAWSAWRRACACA